MAQLIKLQDYISRYETNPFHYPTQYIRLKRENWKKINQLWEMENEQETEIQDDEGVNREGFFKWNPFKKYTEKVEDNNQFERRLPKSKQQLKQYFLNKLYPFQLKWATSTISQISFIDQKYNNDPTLKHFLQRFPDIYLLMYYPVFNIKKAPIDGEIILISPLGIDILVLMNEHPDATIIVGDDRFWEIEFGDTKSRIISPIIPLRRTEQIVKSILNKHEIEFPVQKTILSQTSNILFSEEPYKTIVIGKREYENWLENKRELSSPLKSIQLKATETLLNYCQTTSVKRPEWEEDDDYITPASFESE